MKTHSLHLGLAAFVAAACHSATVSTAGDCVAAPPGLVGWWSADSHARDLSGNYNWGNASDITYATGRVGNAFQFDGVSGQVRIAQSANLNVQSLTLAAWVNPADDTYRPILTYQQPGDYMGAFIWAGKPAGGEAGTLYANLRESPWDNKAIIAPGVISTNQWSFVAVTYDQATGVNRLYVNGAVVKEANIGFLVQRTAAPLYIGHLPGTLDSVPPTSFNGLIDEAQVYNRALTSAELTAIYEAGAAGICKPEEKLPLQLQQATATFSQSDGGDLAVSRAIDGELTDNLGWGIYPEIAPQIAAFEFASDVGFAGGTDFKFRFVFNHISRGFNGQPISPQFGHTLGRFRISVTTDPRDTFADGSKTAGDVTANWTVLAIKSAFSEVGANFTVLDDNSILVSGPQAMVDTYILEAGTRMIGITGIRIEALQHPSLPMNGPGREHNGNITISELIVTAQPGLAPLITATPGHTNVVAGGAASFSVSATSSLPVTYQWFLNGEALAGQTNTTLSIESAGFHHAGTYTAEVANSEGAVVSSGAVLNIIPTDVSLAATLRISNQSPSNAPISDIETNLLTGPTFLAQAYVGATPEALERIGPAVPFLFGDDAGFFVPIELVLTNIAQGSNAFVQLRVWEVAGAANYEAAVQNGAQYGSSEVLETPTGGGALPTPDLSSLTAFSLIAAPQILTHPNNKYAIVGQDPTFEVQLWGSQPFNFKWFFNSNLITTATGASLTLTNVQLDQAGEYYVIVENVAGANTSLVATLTVDVPDVTPPAITLTSPVAGSTYESEATLSGAVTDTRGLAKVTWTLNNGVSSQITLTNGEFSVGGIPLVRGPNIFQVSATDTSTNTTVVEVILTNLASRTLAVGSVPPHQEGSRVSVPILLTSRGDVGGATFDLTFNQSQLVEPEFEWVNLPTGALTTFNPTGPGRVRASFALSGTTLPAGTNHIATISFRAMSVPSTTASQLGLISSGMFGANGQELPSIGTEVKSASVVITRREFIGDNNANDRLDINDATIIMRYVSLLQQRRPWDTVLNDLNKNVQLDVGDVTLVLRAVVGLDPQPTNSPAPISGASLRNLAQGNGRIILTADKQKAASGEKVKVTVSLSDFDGALSGVTFRLQYPTTALKLENSAAHTAGSLVPANAFALWNVAPSQNDYAAQNGMVAAAISTATNWPTSSGVIAEFSFTVQEGAGQRYSWPITVGQVEVSSQFQPISIAGGEVLYLARDAVPPEFGGMPSFSEEGLSLGFASEVGLQYEIQVSEDLLTWELLSRMQGTGGTLTFTDENAERNGQRFYRAVQTE